ncbi:MAG: sugar phosphate isomerase/epimerase, partial [Clostridia bacterium]|nr:sugar phosphate isomerase/epimerase [Clostridia bacterium]
IAEGTGVTLYHENEKGIYGDTDERVLRLVDEFAGRMEFIFDPANFIQCGVNPADAYKKLREEIGYFHIKDALAKSGEVVPAGAGDGHIGDILADYAADHENVMLTVEPHLKSFAGLKDHTSMKEVPTNIYKDNNESFDVAVAALKNILEERGLSYE